MGKTSISWCHYTFNLWWGCWKISPGCQFCYAATFDRRVHGKVSDHWDRTGSRRFMSADYWDQLLAWNRSAKERGVRERVFVGSMCDWTEQHPDQQTNRQMDAFRGRLFHLIQQCDALDFLLLTKRIENAAKYLPWVAAGERPWPNVWLGTTCEDQDHANHRIPILLSIPAAIHWLSLEPLLGEIDLHKIQIPGERGLHFSALQQQHDDCFGYTERVVGWVVAGAESGGKHVRACDVVWLKRIRDACQHSGTPFLLKQAVESELVTIGEGSRAKGYGHGGVVVELPYLEGVQHEAYPEVADAA